MFRYELESAHSESSRLSDEHADLTTERRNLVEEREKLRSSLKEKVVGLSKMEAQLANLQSSENHLRVQSSEIHDSLKKSKKELETQLAVNERLKQGSFKLQDEHRSMSEKTSQMQEKYDEMKIENKNCKQEAEDMRKSTAEIYAQNTKIKKDSEIVENSMKELAAELANYKDLMEQALSIRKNLETKLESECKVKVKNYCFWIISMNF